MAGLAKKLGRGPAYLDFTGRTLHRASPALDLLHPGGALNSNIAEGKPVTGRNVLDPDHLVTKSSAPVTPPPVVPMPDEEQIKTNRRRAATAAQLARSGRQSTILTDTTDRLGP